MAQIAADPNDMDALEARDALQAEMDLNALEAGEEVPIKLNEDEKIAHQLLWKAYREREQKLILHRGQAYSLIMGQCTTGLAEKMKCDAGWTNISMGRDPLALLDVIDRAVLAQNDDTYPFATVYDMDSGLYKFHQDQLSNTEYHEKYNTCVDIARAVGVTRQHKCLLDYEAERLFPGQKYAALNAADKRAMESSAEEKYLALIPFR